MELKSICKNSSSPILNTIHSILIKLSIANTHQWTEQLTNLTQRNDYPKVIHLRYANWNRTLLHTWLDSTIHLKTTTIYQSSSTQNPIISISSQLNPNSSQTHLQEKFITSIKLQPPHLHLPVDLFFIFQVFKPLIKTSNPNSQILTSILRIEHPINTTNFIFMTCS